MNKYIKSSVIVVAALYIVFAGLLIASAVLEWGVDWSQAQTWLVKGAVLAVILLVINTIVAFLTSRLSDHQK